MPRDHSSLETPARKSWVTRGSARSGLRRRPCVGGGGPADRSCELTDGRKADVVYDSIGRQTFEASLDSLRSRGMLVSFGTASGPPPPVELATLNKKGSLFLTRPSVFAYTADAGEYRQRAADVLAALAAGIIQASVWKTFPLAEVAKAHTAIESRQSSGAIVLRP